MTGKEQIKKVFGFMPTKKTPYWFHGISSMKEGAASRLDKYYGSTEWRKKVNDSIHGGHIGFIRKKTAEDMAVDTFGTLIKLGKIIHIAEPVLVKPSLTNYRWPNPEQMVDWDNIYQNVQKQSDKFQLMGLAMGLFERSWFMRGMDKILIDMIEEPVFVEDLLDGITEVHISFMNYLVDSVPIDAVYGGDDMCDQRGVIMGPDRWRYYFKPRLKRIIEHAHNLGLPYILHSCGNILPLIDDLLEIKLDGLESLQPEAMDIFQLKKITHKRMILIGGMGVQSTMFFSTPENVIKEAKKSILNLNEGGGYVFAPAKQLDAEPVENIAALIELVC